jgi:hypothetical protein
VPTPARQAIITVSVWSDDDDPSSPPMARFITSSGGGRPVRAGYACGIDDICESVLAFLIVHFS